MSAPGFLAVFSDPGRNATLDEFHDWYDNEHIPLRMDLPSFLSGARYAAADGKLPGWLAMYEIDRVSAFYDSSYTGLREKRSEREAELIGRLGVLDRRMAEVVLDSGEPDGEKSSGLRVGNPSRFVATLGIVNEGRQLEGAAGLPGWVRTRVLRVFDKDAGVPDYLAVVEFTSEVDKAVWVAAVGQVDGEDWRQWGLYKAYPGIAQGVV